MTIEEKCKSAKNENPFFIVCVPDKAIKDFPELTLHIALTQVLSAFRQLPVSLLTCIMCAFDKKWRFIVVFTVAVLTIALSKKVVEGKREHFYARQSKELRRLANLDFDLMLKLKSLEQSLAHEQESSPLLLSSAVEM